MVHHQRPCTQVLVVKLQGLAEVSLLGRHASKMDMVQGLNSTYVVADAAALGAELTGKFDVCVEASGSSAGIRLALQVCHS